VCCLCELRAGRTRRLAENTDDGRNFRVPADIAQYISAPHAIRQGLVNRKGAFANLSHHLLAVAVFTTLAQIRQPIQGTTYAMASIDLFLLVRITRRGESIQSLVVKYTVGVNKVLHVRFSGEFHLLATLFDED
jgi:hypothetical protein